MTRGDRRLLGAALALGAAGAVSGALSKAGSPRRRRFPRFTVALALVVVAIGSVLSVVAWSSVTDDFVVTCEGVVMTPGDTCEWDSIDRYGVESSGSRDYEEQHAYLYGWRRAGLISAIFLTAAGVLLGVVRVGRWLWVGRGDGLRRQDSARATR